MLGSRPLQAARKAGVDTKKDRGKQGKIRKNKDKEKTKTKTKNDLDACLLTPEMYQTTKKQEKQQKQTVRKTSTKKKREREEKQRKHIKDKENQKNKTTRNDPPKERKTCSQMCNMWVFQNMIFLIQYCTESNPTDKNPTERKSVKIPQRTIQKFVKTVLTTIQNVPQHLPKMTPPPQNLPKIQKNLPKQSQIPKNRSTILYFFQQYFREKMQLSL